MPDDPCVAAAGEVAMRVFLATILIFAVVLQFMSTGSADTSSIVCAPNGSSCTTTVSIGSANAADIIASIHKILPGFDVAITSSKKMLAMTGHYVDVAAALKIVANIVSLSESGGKSDPVKVDQICTIDNVSPLAAPSIVDGLNKFLNGSGPTPAPGTSTTAPDFGASNGSVILDSSQRKIFVHATKPAIDQLRLAIRTFSNTSYGDPVSVSYSVRYAAPNPIPEPSGSPAQGAISAVSSVAGTNQATSTVVDLAGAVSAAMAQASPSVIVTPDASFPRIIVSGPRQGVDRALALLRELDRKPPLIEFNAQVISINNNAANQLGMTLPSSISGSVGSYTAPIVGSSSATPGPLFAGKIVSTAGPNVMLQLNTLLQQGNARVISNPRVSTLNGRMAVIDVGQVIPFAATGSNGTVTLTSSIFNYVIGTHLEMVPMVNYDGSISVYVHPINSTFTQLTNQNAPQFERREMSASFRIGNGEAVFLSGLTETDDSDNRGQAPILNLIPFLGKHVLGSHFYSRIQTSLTIIITAKLVDLGEYDYNNGPDNADLNTPPPPVAMASPAKLSLKCTWVKGNKSPLLVPDDQAPPAASSTQVPTNTPPAGGGGSPQPAATVTPIRVFSEPKPDVAPPPLGAKPI